MKITRKALVHFIVAFVLFGILEFIIPVASGLTPQGKNYLCVFIPLIYLWLTVDTFVSSFVALAAITLLQVAPSNSILAGTFGNATVILLVTSSLLLNPLADCGLTKKIAQWFLSRKAIAGHPYVFFFLLGLAAFVLAALINNTNSPFVLVPMVFSICDSIGYKKGDKFYTAAFLMTMWCCLAGGTALPYAKSLFLSVQGVAAGYGIDVSYFEILKQSVLVGFAWVIMGVAVIKFVIRPDTKNFSSYDPNTVRAEMKAIPLTKKGKWLTVGFIVLMICWSLTLFSGLFPLATYLNGVGFTLIAAAVVAVLTLIQVDGEPAIDLRKAVQKVPWPIVGFMTMVLYSTSAVGAKEFGIKEFLIAVLGPIFSNVSPAVLLIVACITTAVLTNFISNNVTSVVVISVFLPLILTIPDLGGFSALSFCLAVTFISNMSVLTPGAFPAAPMVLGPHVEIKDGVPSNLTMVILGTIMCIGLAYIFG